MEENKKVLAPPSPNTMITTHVIPTKYILTLKY